MKRLQDVDPTRQQADNVSWSTGYYVRLPIMKGWIERKTRDYDKQSNYHWLLEISSCRGGDLNPNKRCDPSMVHSHFTLRYTIEGPSISKL